MKTMKDFKGTQGEFKFTKWPGENWPEKRFSISVDGHGISKAICISPRYFSEGEESEANFKLLANSKRVLEAAIELTDHINRAHECVGQQEAYLALMIIKKNKLEQAINDSL